MSSLTVQQPPADPDQSRFGEDTATAAALAGAQLAANGIAVVFTVALARLLGRDGYGELIALGSAFLILSVPGYALQVASARATAIGTLGAGGALAATVRRWSLRIFGAVAALAVLGVLVREPIRLLIGIDSPWAAALTLPTCGVWVLLSLQRGVLCGVRAYRPVGFSIVAEQLARLVVAASLAAAGAGVTGAYLGLPVAMAATALALAAVLHAQLGPPTAGARDIRRLRDFAPEMATPIAALTLIGALQNVDVIAIRHQVDGDAAGAYAAAAVAAKLIVWTAVGVGLYLLPEAARRAASGGDARPILARALVLLVAVAAPALVIFALAPELLLRLAFGEEYTSAAGALVVLGLAMSVLGCGYLAVQYLLALGSAAFLLPLAAVAVAEPVLLLASDISHLATFAALVLAVQVAGALAVLVPSLRRAPEPVAART